MSAWGLRKCRNVQALSSVMGMVDIRSAEGPHRHILSPSSTAVQLSQRFWSDSVLANSYTHEMSRHLCIWRTTMHLNGADGRWPSSYECITCIASI